MVDWNPEYLYSKIFDSKTEVDFFLEHVCTFNWNAQQDAGRTLEEATRVLVETHPTYTKEIKAYYQRWTEMLNGHIAGTLEIFEHLKNRGDHRLLALTNWSAETFPTALEIFDFLHWFEGIVVSGHEKLIKPDREIYQVLFDRYSIDPNESLFIDDSFPNIETSRELGMTGIHFNHPDQLEKELKLHGVI